MEKFREQCKKNYKNFFWTINPSYEMDFVWVQRCLAYIGRNLNLIMKNISSNKIELQVWTFLIRNSATASGEKVSPQCMCAL